MPSFDVIMLVFVIIVGMGICTNNKKAECFNRTRLYTFYCYYT